MNLPTRSCFSSRSVISALAALATFLSILTATANAQDESQPKAPAGDVESFVREAIAANRMLRSHLDGVDAARAAARTKGTLPDPVLGFGYFVETPETRVGPQESAWTLSQRIPFPGKLGLERDIAEKSAGIAEEGYRRRQIDLRYDVKAWFYELYAAVNVLDVLEDEVDVLREMENIAQIRYGSGLVRQQDALKAQLALTQVDDEIEVATRRRVTAEAAIRSLLDRSADADVARPVHGDAPMELPPLERLTGVALDNRPEIAAADIAAARAADARALAKRSYWPDLTLGARYIQVGERDNVTLDDNGKDVFQVSAAVSIPLWVNRRSAAVRQAKAEASRAHNERAGWETSIKNQVSEARERVFVAEERVALHRDVIIPQAEQTFGASESAYQTGTLDFLGLLDSERMLLAARKRYFEVVADYGAELANLERTLGVPLGDVR